MSSARVASDTKAGRASTAPLRGRRSWRMQSGAIKPHYALGAGAAVAIVALAGSLFAGGHGRTNGAAGSPKSDVLNPALGVVGPGQPCPGAQHADTAAQLKTDVHIWEPKNEKLTDAWTCGSTPVLMYGDVQVSFEAGWGDVVPNAKWAQMVEDFGGSIDAILGRPAYVHAADESGPQDTVMMVAQGELVRLIATKDVPISELTRLAADIDAPSN
ncbi:MAG: hypothetical protein ACR2K3_02630 [Nocardioides sp.]